MRACFDATESLLRTAAGRALFNDHPALERNLRHLRLVRKHALRVFQQCRREIQPLYDALRRSSFIAEGAALMLQRLQSGGIAAWSAGNLMGVHQIRIQNVPSDAAIATALERLTDSPPAPPPVVVLDPLSDIPAALLRRQWLDELPGVVGRELPLDDLLGWLLTRHPEKSTSEVLSGFTALVFHPGFAGAFSDTGERDYRVTDGVIRGAPFELERAQA